MRKPKDLAREVRLHSVAADSNQVPRQLWIVTFPTMTRMVQCPPSNPLASENTMRAVGQRPHVQRLDAIADDWG